ncbi:MAG TPA: LLM class flavin-dependent oxidoreductase, partial [Thermomicrobiales bacterium]|nr:LLM class flavin-dependent oxidoreductase [Thermomicrobiales bacterium]
MSEAGPRLRFAVDSHHSVFSKPQQRGSRDDLRAAVDGLVTFARTADRAGVDSFWLTEDPDGWDALAVLGAIARETERIRLGTGVVNPYYRHPSLIAASMSTLDALSDGRAFLGLGRGQPEWYERGLGMEVGSPLAALEESFQLLRQWFERGSDPNGSASGAWMAVAAPDAAQFKVTRWERATGPVQPHLPIYLAAVGPKALSIAARYADGVVFNELTSATFMERTIRDVRSEAADAGRDPDAISFFARSGVTITDDPQRVWEQRKVTVAIIHTLPGMGRLLETPGFDTEAIIARAREVMRTDEVL